jgi:endonuclease/exonuclease/phosphatase family metal-dependent hydrolase
MNLNDANLLSPVEEAMTPDFNPWPVTVATWNIHSSIGTDGRFAPERIGEVIREMNADIVGLQEVPLGGEDWPDVLHFLRETTGYHGVEGPTHCNPRRRFGNAVLSRYPIIASRSIDLSFGRCEPRGALDADIDCHGHPLRIIATHLGLRPGERRAQIKTLLEVFGTNQMPMILMGDINEWLTWGRPLRMLESHFEAVPAPVTFPSRYPVFALDRIWISPRHRLVHVNVHVTPLSRLASDHLPLIARITG